MLRVKNDIMMLIDQSKAVVLALLDLFSVFSTVDSDFFRLEELFGFQALCLTGLCPV